MTSSADWNRADWERLWLYNAHYFDDLVADGAAGRRVWHEALIARWIAENPPSVGAGWEPYPISLRLVNWIKWVWLQDRIDPRVAHSMAIQTRALSQRIEHHLLGNHLWANAKALVFAGTFFAGVEAEVWKRHGLALIARELDEQILNDGGHFERSPMYHAIVLEDLLDLVQLAAQYPTLVSSDTHAHWRAVATRMLAWLRAMSHPDGGIAFFNDAAHDIAPSCNALRQYANAIGVATATETAADGVLIDSGFARFTNASAVLLADVGSVGPSYLPGHAHAGTLSFELSVNGFRVLVNSGISTYPASGERLRQRGTAAHNTVLVNSDNSSEVWGSFRVARRARVHEVRTTWSGEATELSASHDGYKQRGHGVVHHRAWRLAAQSLSVTDTLSGAFSTAEARFHFAPGQRLAYEIAGGSAHIESGTWHPRFGESVPNSVLVVRFTQPSCRVTFAWD